MENYENPLLQAFVDTGLTFHEILNRRKFVPTHRDNGFTERNITFNLCKCFAHNNLGTMIWQEMPILPSDHRDHQHIDSIIIKEKDNIIDVYYIEAKRIYGENFASDSGQSSLESDYERFMRIGFGDYNFIKNFPGLIDSVRHTYKDSSYYFVRQHIVFIAGLEHIKNNYLTTLNSKTEGINSFLIGKGFDFYHYDVKNRLLDKQCQITERYDKKDEKSVLCMNCDGTIYVNYHLYLMEKRVTHKVEK